MSAFRGGGEESSESDGFRAEQRSRLANTLFWRSVSSFRACLVLALALPPPFPGGGYVPKRGIIGNFSLRIRNLVSHDGTLKRIQDTDRQPRRSAILSSR